MVRSYGPEPRRRTPLPELTLSPPEGRVTVTDLILNSLRKFFIGREQNSSVTHERGFDSIEFEIFAKDISRNRSSLLKETCSCRVVPEASAAILLRQLQITRECI